MTCHFLNTIIFLVIFLGIGTFAQESKETVVWSFRINNDKPSDIKAFYSGPNFDQDLTDFTICLRFNIHIFHQKADTYAIFRAKSSESGEEIRLYMSKQWYHQFRLNNGKGHHLNVWFESELPLRQWNSMCIMRNMKKEKFQIYQNGNLVYSYNECFTKEAPAKSIIYPGHAKNQ